MKEQGSFWAKCKEDFPYLGVMAIAIAFLGWAIENVLRLIAVGVIDCRYHLLPFISPYGLASFAVYFFIGNPNDIAVFGKRLFCEKSRKTVALSHIFCFLFPCLFIFCGEILVGHIWEWCFGVELWNYNEQPLHITKYSGVLPAVGGGTACFFAIRFLFFPIFKWLKEKMPKKLALWLCCTLGTVIVLDTAFISVYSGIFGVPPMYWSWQIR